MDLQTNCYYCGKIKLIKYLPLDPHEYFSCCGVAQKHHINIGSNTLGAAMFHKLINDEPVAIVVDFSDKTIQLTKNYKELCFIRGAINISNKSFEEQVNYLLKLSNLI